MSVAGLPVAGAEEGRSIIASDSYPLSLSVSLVVHQPDEGLLKSTLAALRASLAEAQSARLIDSAHVILINHGPNHAANHILLKSLTLDWDAGQVTILEAENRGFGTGHNAASQQPGFLYHLVLNPDVTIHSGALAAALQYLGEHPEAGMITPKAFDGSGTRQYLCKQYPDVLTLLLRSCPRLGLQIAETRMNRYEMRGITEDTVVGDIPIASGCFMLIRRKAFDSVSGFDENFFLYFEDFDLSLRLRQAGWKIVYLPEVKITHYGGMAARKGIKHHLMFCSSAFRFFNKHGWKWA